MKCEKCGSEMRMVVHMVVSAPSSMESQFSKKNIRSKDFKVVCVNWETADYFCENNECRHFVLGYGNYVTNLKKDLDAAYLELHKIRPAVKAIFDREVWDKMQNNSTINKNFFGERDI